jgi:hypothetical protein
MNHRLVSFVIAVVVVVFVAAAALFAFSLRPRTVPPQRTSSVV